jgi:hypothetical protein
MPGDHPGGDDPGRNLDGRNLDGVEIVCASDGKVMHLTLGLLMSLRDGLGDRLPPVTVLDVGLEEADRTRLEQLGARVITIGWDLYVRPGVGMGMGDHFKAMTARPFLPRYVPNAEIVVWLDVDTWLQDPAALDRLVAGARSGVLAIAPELDRVELLTAPDGRKMTVATWRAFAYGSAGLGYDDAKRLSENPVLNSGVFAMRADAPHWAAWAETLERALTHNVNFFIEQTSLNIILYRDGFGFELLSPLDNWVPTIVKPLWDAERQMLVEPTPPHRPLGIVHLAGRPKYSHARVVLLNGGGEKLIRPIQYDRVRAERLAQEDRA